MTSSVFCDLGMTAVFCFCHIQIRAPSLHKLLEGKTNAVATILNRKLQSLFEVNKVFLLRVYLKDLVFCSFCLTFILLLVFLFHGLT